MDAESQVKLENFLAAILKNICEDENKDPIQMSVADVLDILEN
jgi:hypothetical protein